jgi:hypothetical protein
MITYNWVIDALHTLPEPIPEFIVTVVWRYQAEENKITTDMVGSSVFNAPTKGEYIPYKDITREMVIAWIEADLGEKQLLWMQETLARSLFSIQNPPVVPVDTPLPWESQ